MVLAGIEYLYSLLNELCKFRDRLDKLSYKVYPAPILEELIKDNLIPIVDFFKKIVLEEINDMKRNNNYNQINNEVFVVIKIWSQNCLQNIAKAISNSDFKSQPLEIMNVFRDLIKEINSKDFEILTITTEEMNYSFTEIWSELRNVMEENLNINNLSVNKNLIRLSFPEEQKDNILLSGIFFHEVGHYLERESKLLEKIYTKINYDSNEFKSLKKYIINTQEGSQIKSVDLIKIMYEIYLGPWLREIISDSIAIYLLGPAYVFSMMEFVITACGNKLLTDGKLDDYFSYSHPAFRCRYRFLLNNLKDLSIMDKLPPKISDKIITYHKAWNNAAFLINQRVSIFITIECRKILIFL